MTNKTNRRSDPENDYTEVRITGTEDYALMESKPLENVPETTEYGIMLEEDGTARDFAVVSREGNELTLKVKNEEEGFSYVDCEIVSP